MISGLSRRSLLFLFALSGFSGLIYESVWSHYLKLFLGHSAYAQALVLVIFMGGMAIGAWLVSRISHRITNLLLGYAIVEGLIGLFGLVFHELFTTVNSFSFLQVIPDLDESYIFLYKIVVASILILPQSILLGTTFPLMCGGFIRKYPAVPGKSISLLYFSNSLGAALALLFSTFYLIGRFGLPGTIFTAGLINIGIAIFVYGFSKQPVFLNQSQPVRGHSLQVLPMLFLSASFFTGMASFIYEVAWIRMLSMVMGSSTHSFELMLSAFITGLAIGGYWIRKYIDSIKDAVRYAGTIQVVMGLFAFSTIFLYNYSFEIMSFLVRALDKTDQGYILFNISGQGLAMLIMLPATICAGMTLPLFTFAMLKQGHGEKSVGLIYSSNTIGAIVGVMFAVFVGMPVLGLKNSILTGATIDIIIGLVLLAKCTNPPRLKYPVSYTILFLVLFLYSAISYDFNTKRMASGVFRHGYPEMGNDVEVLFHEDGKTASINVVRNIQKETILISTNGKPDASITMNKSLPPTLDEVTMKLLAALPLSIYPEARKVANIGMGSGLTTHIVLTWPSVERVDTIEIEEAMIDGAQLFLPENEKTFNDPRSHIHIADAKTFFSTYKQKYDIIISEPSNPWVSGVSSLFTQEFYSAIRNNLNSEGIFAQWIHTYEFNIDLYVSILKSLSAAFPYYSVYFTDSGNIILIASQEKQIPSPDPAIFDSYEISDQLSQIHINNIYDLKFRFLGDQDLYNPYIKHYPVPYNSDYYPILDLKAPKYRFLGNSVTELLDIRQSLVPLLDVLYGIGTGYGDKLTASKYYLASSANVIDANNIYRLFDKGGYLEDYQDYITSMRYLTNVATSCIADNQSVWVNSLFLIMHKTVNHLTSEQINRLLVGFTPVCNTPVLSDYQHDWLDYFAAVGSRDITTMVNVAHQLLLPDSVLTTIQRKYLITSLLAGLIKLQEFEQAANLWNKSVADLFSTQGVLPLEIKLLLALIDQRMTIGP